MRHAVMISLAIVPMMALRPATSYGQDADGTDRHPQGTWSLAWMPLHLMNVPNVRQVGDAFPLTRGKSIGPGVVHLEVQRRLNRNFLLGIRMDMADQRVSGYQVDSLISETFFFIGSTYTYNGDMVGIDQRLYLIGPQFAYEPALGHDRKWLATSLRFHAALQYMALREHHYINPDRTLSFSRDVISASFGLDPEKPGQGPDYPLPLNRVATHVQHGVAMQLGVRAMLHMGERFSVTVFDLSGLVATPMDMPSSSKAAANGREARIDAHRVAIARVLVSCGIAVHL